MQHKYKDAVIYLVDDDLDMLDSLSILLKTAGFKAISYESAEDFLHNYSPRQTSCLVLDLQMPLMNGHELQEELKKRNIYIPIIFISGNADISDTAKAFKSGAVDFLEKPFVPNKLLERIEEVLENTILDQQRQQENYKVHALFESLSSREKEVLQLIVSNYSSKQAAKELDVSHRTVEAHRAHIMEKMHASSATELVALAVKHALI